MVRDNWGKRWVDLGAGQTTASRKTDTRLRMLANNTLDNPGSSNCHREWLRNQSRPYRDRYHSPLSTHSHQSCCCCCCWWWSWRSRGQSVVFSGALWGPPPPQNNTTVCDSVPCCDILVVFSIGASVNQKTHTRPQVHSHFFYDPTEEKVYCILVMKPPKQNVSYTSCFEWYELLWSGAQFLLKKPLLSWYTFIACFLHHVGAGLNISCWASHAILNISAASTWSITKSKTSLVTAWKGNIKCNYIATTRCIRHAFNV